MLVSDKSEIIPALYRVS